MARSIRRVYSPPRLARGWILSLAGLVALAGLIGWRVLWPALHPPQYGHPLVIVLGDTSQDSTAATRERAQQVFDDAVNQMRDEHGAVAASPVATLFESTSDWQSKDFVPPASDKGDTAGTEDDLSRRAASFKRAERTLLLTQPDRLLPGSDIVGAFRGTATEFGTFPDVTERIIVIVSNMANVSQHIVLKQPYTTAQLKAKVVWLKEHQRTGPLLGACVYVVDAGEVGSRGFPPLAPSVESTIRIFWRLYIRSNGAHLLSWGHHLSTPLTCPWPALPARAGNR